MISTEMLCPWPAGYAVTLISTLVRTEPATEVSTKFMMTYLKRRWLHRICSGTFWSINGVFNWMLRFLNSLSNTPLTCSRISAILKLVTFWLNDPSQMLYTYSKSRILWRTRFVSLRVSSATGLPDASRWLSSFCKLIRDTSEASWIWRTIFSVK